MIHTKWYSISNRVVSVQGDCSMPVQVLNWSPDRMSFSNPSLGHSRSDKETADIAFGTGARRRDYEAVDLGAVLIRK